ncbi:glycosyltransferase [Nitrospirillum iridis]|uniref:Glycosyltransferase involved in cell wall biosynthesis n=1 Tax=Nitrospirillum iridis TaxID=765888 RepID=A0A7X0AXP0_9PROT|nr:glycosyltransferase involved in cell wall biosynthesis [Nitrospirillum iridis]
MAAHIPMSQSGRPPQPPPAFGAFSGEAAPVQSPASVPALAPAPREEEGRRFDRVAITSVFGDPSSPRTWSGAPRNLGVALEKLGVTVEGFHPHLSKTFKMGLAARHMMGGYGRLMTSEQLYRAAPARRHLARQLAAQAAQRGTRHIIHTGALDLPAVEEQATADPMYDRAHRVHHYLYCDHTWALAAQHRPDIAGYSARALAAYEDLERRSLHSVDHVFTFGRYVRDHIIAHYGVPAARVTAVGSGMGDIKPYIGPKDYAKPRLLFVCKHLFREKGGELVVEAFQQALMRRPDLTLTIVADPSVRDQVPAHPAIDFRSGLPWAELQELYRRSSLLVQPMLNDPWGQVYLEALISRTPVLGLMRNGLPEITGDGRYGFLAARADPGDLADLIVHAVSDPQRLAVMGARGQNNVLETYNWDRVARAVLFP